MKTSIPGHEINCGNGRFWPMYTDNKGRLRYYRLKGKLVSHASFDAALEYIYRRNPIGNAEQRKRKGWTSESYR